MKSGRNAAWNRPPETTYDQKGPTPLYKFEDTFLATEDLILSGKFAYVGGGFQLMPKGGDNIATYDIATDMYGGSKNYYITNRPQWQLTVTAEKYIDEAFGGSHEIKAGFEWRKTPVTSLSGYGAGMVQALYNGAPIEIWLYGDVDARKVLKRTSFYLMDVFNRDRLTLNVGVRYDRQWACNLPSTADGNFLISDLIPDINYQGSDTVFKTTDIMPRIGATYDLFGDGKTVIRANFSMYGDQTSPGIAQYENPLGWREIDYEWNDINGDRTPQRNELGGILYWYGVNPFDPGAEISSGMVVDTDQLMTTYEIILGAERELMPNLALSGTYVYRYFTDFNWLVDDSWVNDPYTLAGSVTQAGYTRDYYEPTMAAAGTSTYMPQEGFHRAYQGIEVQLTKRLSDKWMANASFSYGDTKEYYDGDKGYTDPTNIEVTDGYSYAPVTSGSGKESIFMNSRWAFKMTGLYQLPWDINVSGYLSMREGFAYIVRMRSANRNFSAGQAYPIAEPIGDNHLPTMTMLDFRAEKSIKVSDFGRLGVTLDIFNVLNTNTELGRNRNAYSTTFGLTTEIVNPRILRLGVRFQF